MAKVVVRGINVHYQQRGEGPDVVLIHGVTSSLAAWYNGVLPSIAEAGFRVTVYDLRGHGLTEMTPGGYTSHETQLDLEALLDTLGITQAAFVGHSFGGAIAMNFAMLHPERTRGVILLDSAMAVLRHMRMIQDWGGWANPGLKEEGFTAEWFEGEDSKDDLSEFLRKGLSVPRLQGFRKGQIGLTPRIKKLLEETRVGTEMRDVGQLTEEGLATIQTPVLALFGENSPNRKMAVHLSGLLPNCAHILIPGAGHFSVMHDPQPFLQYMTPFFPDPAGFIQKLKSGAIPVPALSVPEPEPAR